MGAVRGITGLGNISNISQYNTVKPHLVGWRFRWDWVDMETSPGVFDFSSMEADIQRVVNDGLYFGFQVSISPVDVSPQWLFVPPYNVPKVTGAKQTYPYYFSSVFEQRKQIMLDAVRAWVQGWDSSWLDLLVYWFIVDGKTGDEGTGIETVTSVTINGVAQPNPQAYVITNDQWNTYKLTESWPQFFSDLEADLPTVLGAVNPSNNAENWAQSISDFENTGLKLGQVTHNYNNIGELFYANRCNALTATIPSNFLFGETENTNDTGWFQTSTRQNMLALILSGITHGNVMQNISLKTFTELININNSDDWWMFDFANDFLGLRIASESNKAFISLRDCLDGANLQRFPESAYGNLVTNQAQYNSKYNQIINSSASQEYKEDQLASLLAIYFNPARGTAIGAAFPNLKFQTLDNANDHDAYNQDGGVYMLGNYKKFINQYDPYNTCIGFARIGSTSQPHGRWCCGTSTEMFFYFDNGIVNNNSYNATFKIWYYDEGNKQWSLQYWNGTSKVSAGTVTNTNTNEWIEKTYTINNFYGGGNINFGNDFSIKSEDGSITKIEIIRFDRISENTVGTSGVYILGNDSGTICGGSQVTKYTDGSFAVGKILYNDSALTSIVTSSTFVLNTANNTIYALDSSTGVIGASTGLTCSGSAVSGTYILGNTLSSICNESTGTYYTDGSFNVGDTLYTDSGLSIAATGFDYVVRSATGIIYNINSGTGVIGSATSSVCGGGYLTVALLGNDINTVCEQSPTNVYTDGRPDIGSIAFSDINLTTPLTGYTLAVRNSNGKIFLLDDSTGEILQAVGSCGIGLAIDVLLGNEVPDICSSNPTTVYVIGNVKTGVFLYADANITTPVTGYIYVSANGFIYNLSPITGMIISVSDQVCLIGAGGSYQLSNTTNGICEEPVTTLYLVDKFKKGQILYTDISLTTPITGYKFVVDIVTQSIYSLNDVTGEIGRLEKVSCSSGEQPPQAPYIYNIINDASSFKRVIRAVMIDARATTLPKNATGFEIDAIINETIAAVTINVLFFKLETSEGNLVGYFTLGISNHGATATLNSLVLRPAFQKNISIITEQINNFIQTNEYQNYILSAS